MDERQVLRTLERDLGRLEGIVDALVASVKMEHDTTRQARLDDRAAMTELGKRLESVVAGLAEEIKGVATTANEERAEILQRQAVHAGGVKLSRYLLATALTVAALAAGFLKLPAADPPAPSCQSLAGHWTPLDVG